MQPNRIMVPTAVTICLSLSFPELRGNAHTVVFTPSRSTTKREKVGRQRWMRLQTYWKEQGDCEKCSVCFGRALGVEKSGRKMDKTEGVISTDSTDSYLVGMCWYCIFLAGLFGAVFQHRSLSGQWRQKRVDCRDVEAPPLLHRCRKNLTFKAIS